MDSTHVDLSTGARLFVASKGGGDELVIFLHSAGGDHTSWYLQMEAIGERYTALACDLRGHGRSAFDVEDTIVREAISVSAFAKDVIALIEKHGFRRAHLVGLGLGGAIALEVFRRRSDVVQSLTLAGTWAYHPDGESHAATRLSVAALFGDGTPPALVERAMRIDAATNHHVNLASWQAMFAGDYRRAIELIDVPALLVAATHDPLAPPELLAAIRSSLPAAELVTIDGAGHFSNLDHPNEFTRALRAHLVRARASETQRIGFSDPTPEHSDAQTIRGALEALLDRRGVRVMSAGDDATALAMAHGGWLVSGRAHAAVIGDKLHIVADSKRAKWTHELSSAAELEALVDRAIAIAISEPAGCVTLTFAPGFLERKIDGFAYSSLPRQMPQSSFEPSPDALDRAVQLLAGGQRPLALVSELGRFRGGIESLVQLAQRHGIPVVESRRRRFVNFPTRHSLHLGFDATPFARQSDIILAIETTADDGDVAHGPRIIQIGIDPLEIASSTSGFPADLTLAGDPSLTLRRLCIALDKARPDHSRNDARSQVFASEHRRALQQVQSRAIGDAAKPVVTKAFLSYCLGEALTESTIIVNDGGADPSLVPRRLADTWFDAPLGAALGAQFAAPDATVVATLDAASYVRGNPLAAHHVASQRRLPLAIVVLNDTDAQFAKLAESCGGTGLRADSPRELPRALRTALDLVRERRQHVLLDVRA
jgi:acetolactate synthase-1/2/3 large subunit